MIFDGAGVPGMRMTGWCTMDLGLHVLLVDVTVSVQSAILFTSFYHKLSGLSMDHNGTLISSSMSRLKGRAQVFESTDSVSNQ